MLLVHHYHNTIRYYYCISYEDIPQLTSTTPVVSDPYHISHDEVCTLLYNVILIVCIVPFTWTVNILHVILHHGLSRNNKLYMISDNIKLLC